MADEVAPWNTPAPAERAPWDTPESGAPQESAGRQRAWSDVPGEALRNVVPSAGRFARDIGHAIMHPIETGQTVGRVGMGAAQKAGLLATEPGNDFRSYADAVGKMIKERYGSVDNWKKTLATDPVGAAADISTAFTGAGGVARGTGAVARAAGAARTADVAETIGKAASTVGRAADPTAVVTGPAKAAKAVAPYIIGELGTHTGAESIKTAAEAGAAGGKAAEVFQENLRRNAPLEETVSEARRAVNNLRQRRSTLYKSQMRGVATDPTVLDFTKIDDALIKSTAVQTFKGKDLAPGTGKLRAKMAQAVQDWKKEDPKLFHTAEGLDALKRKLGVIRDNTKYGTPARKVADDIYNAVRQTIVDQAPEYAKIMKGYEQASTQIRELEKTLSLDPNARIDTALRKLQSILRNNVTTNYGQRRELADFLVKSGAPHLMRRLAGQALSTWFPRGLGKMVATQGLGAVAGAVGGGAPGAGAAMLGMAPFMSPRLMGEAAYYAGKASRPFRGVAPAVKLATPASRAGRLDEEREKYPPGNALAPPQDALGP